MIYKTTTSSLAVSVHDLVYAMDEDNAVIPEKILPVHQKTVSFCPDLISALTVDLASIYIPSRFAHTTACKHLRAALREKFMHAAIENQKCLQLKKAGCLVTLKAYPYLFATNENRFALCQHPLYHATSTVNSSVLREEMLSEEDMAQTIITTNYPLAVFLTKLTCSSFCEATDKIDSSHHPENIYLNKIQLRKDSADQVEAFVRDGDVTIAMPDVMNSIKSDTDLQPLRALLAQAEFQIAACSVHHDISTLNAAGAMTMQAVIAG